MSSNPNHSRRQQLGNPAGELHEDEHEAYGNTPPSQLSSHAQTSGGGRRRKGLVSGLVRGVATGIGLASESYHHHQEKKKKAQTDDAITGTGESSSAVRDTETRPQGFSQAPPEYVGRNISSEHHDNDGPNYEYDGQAHVNPETSRQLDEAVWQLDDAQFQLAPPPDYATATDQDINIQAMADGFVTNHQLPSSQQTQHRGLPMPVILPQRRPGERARGFINAYAPLLQETGIDQTTFMDFVNDLNKATAPSPWIHAINVASVAVQHVPEPITIAVAIAAQVATQVSLQAHSRSKTNDFLNKINAEFFRSLGLIAVVMTWKPSREGEVVTQVTFDAVLHQATENASGPEPGATSSISSRMQASHATTNFEWPESAPLVFPALDKLSSTPEGRQAAEATAQKQPNTAKRGMLFAMDYMDKRSQAQWASEHPESQLAQLGVKPEFHSRYADPNHPASSGSLLALLTGGAVGSGMSERKQARSGRMAVRRDRQTAMREERREERGPTILGTIGPRKLIGGVKKFMHEDVLYLMIANLPSNDEMAAAQKLLDTQPSFIY